MKSTINLFVCLLFLTPGIAQKSDFAWVKNTFSDQGNSPTIVSSEMVVKPNGDMYLAGSNGKAGNGVAYGQPCLAKYKASGNIKWVNYYSGDASAGAANSHRILEDSDGNMIAMYYGSELDFDGTSTPISPNYVLVKYDTAGVVKWVNNFGGNQITIREVVVTDDGNVAVIVQSQFVTVDDTTITSNNIDILLVADGASGDFTIKDHAGYWPQGGFMTYTKAVAFGDNSIKVITHEAPAFQVPHTFLVEVDLDDNSMTVKDTMDGVFPPASVNISNGTISNVLDFNPNTMIAYVSGRASMQGVNIGNDSIYGVNANSQSTFIAKMNFGTKDVLEKVVYYTPGTEEGVQRAVLDDNQITFFVVYRDTLRNTATGDEYTSIDTLPNNGPHPHCLIQNFDLDLNLNYYNQTARLGGTSTCNSAGYDATGNLFMLHASGNDQYFDNFLINTQETVILSRIGEDEPNGVAEFSSNDRLKLYPNPASDIVSISTEGALESVQIFDLAGQLVMEPKGPSVNVSSLTSGVYVISAQANGTKQTEKLMIKR